MSEIDIRAGGKKRMEEDKLHPEKLLQDRQHKLNLERDKRSLRLSKIAIGIAIFSLLINLLTYFQIIPKHANIVNKIAAPTTTPEKKNQ